MKLYQLLKMLPSNTAPYTTSAQWTAPVITYDQDSIQFYNSSALTLHVHQVTQARMLGIREFEKKLRNFVALLMRGENH